MPRCISRPPAPVRRERQPQVLAAPARRRRPAPTSARARMPSGQRSGLPRAPPDPRALDAGGNAAAGDLDLGKFGHGIHYVRMILDCVTLERSMPVPFEPRRPAAGRAARLSSPPRHGGPHRPGLRPQPSPPAVRHTAPAAIGRASMRPLFYQLLIGEIELRAGEAGTAYQLMLDAAGAHATSRLFRRADRHRAAGARRRTGALRGPRLAERGTRTRARRCSCSCRSCCR